MKRLFFTGLVILLPLVLTVLFVIFIINILTNPFTGLVNSLFSYYGFIDHPILYAILGKLLSLVLVLFTILAIGFLANFLTLHLLIYTGEQIIARIPIVNRLYISIQESIQSFFKNSRQSFKQVVIVPFPNKKGYTFGLVSSHQELLDGKVSVFIPSAPNPIFGLVLMYPSDSVRLVNTPVEDILKFVVSFGNTPI